LARLILDSGAVIALSRRDARARALVKRASEQGDLIIVPAVVVAETTRGGPRDAPVNQVLKALDEIAPVTETIARLAGSLLARSAMKDGTADALVAAEAIHGGSAVIATSDPDDLSRLVGDTPRIRVYGM
jgi:predicted nucleic acid-binding protein